jgi:hypothetical protein
MQEVLFPPLPDQEHEIHEDQKADDPNGNEIQAQEINTRGTLYHGRIYVDRGDLLLHAGRFLERFQYSESPMAKQ